MGMGCQSHAPAAVPPGKTWYQLYRRLGENISPPLGFDPWAVQPVVNRYTDCAILAQSVRKSWILSEN